MKNYIPQRIAEMKEYQPDTSNPQIKLDANESPFPTPEKIVRLLRENICYSDINRYPDPDMKELLGSYGRYMSVSPDRIVAGDGSDELIALIINTFLCDGGKFLVCDPDFSMYTFYSDFAGCETVRYRKKNGILTDFRELSALVKKEDVKLVMFSNPCNPTGVIADRKTVIDFVRSCDALVVVDEAYMEFSPVSQSVISETEQLKNLIVLKTVSKLGLAGLRCGFSVSCKELAATLRKTKSPYNMNSVTQKAVSVAMDSIEEYRVNIEKIKDGVKYLYSQLKEYSDKLGFYMPESSANFVYMKFGEDDEAKSLHVYLKERRISVRFAPGSLRVTAGTEKENRFFINAVAEYSDNVDSRK